MKRKHKEVEKPNTGKLQYIGDPQLIPRVKKFLDESRKKFITSSMIADNLQRNYGDYARKKKGTFFKSVDKVYQMMSEMGGDDDVDSSEDEEEDETLDYAEREHLKQRNQRDNQNNPADSGSDYDIIDDDNEEYMEYKDTNAMNSFMSDLYNQNKKHPQKITLSKLTKPEFYEDRTPSHDIAATVGKVQQQENTSRSGKKSKVNRLGAQDMPRDRGGLLSNQTTPTREEQGGLPSDACTPIIEIASDNDATTDVSKAASSTKRKKKHKSASDKKITKKAKPAGRSDRDVEIPDLQKSTVTFADVGGNEVTLKEICQLLVHMKHPEVYRVLGVTPPRGILLHGPPGSGKTLLAHAIAGELDLPLLKLAATEIVSGVSGESEERIRQLFEKAVSNSPCIMFIDEIDAITPKRETASKDMERRIVAQLLSCLDDLNIQCNTGVLIIGATNRPDSLDPALRRAGRFDKEISLGIPDEAARGRILEVLCRPLKLQEGFNFSVLAHLTPGFVGADLMALTREAAITAVNKAFSQIQNQTKMDADAENIVLGEDSAPSIGESVDDAKICNNKPEVDILQEEVKVTELELKTVSVNLVIPAVDDLKSALSWLRDQPPLTDEQLNHLSITMQDFEEAVQHVQPSAKREGFATIPDVTWDDIGALADVREELQLAILAPVRHRKEFLALGLQNPPGILLAGPPGCGKTLLAKAVANESGINFISVKGPELLNMYVGESERAVRQVFQRARNSSPCVIFFDELDALCPRRVDHGEGGASVRVVNQLLTEMDGLEERKQVFIMAASNRPDIIDPAVLRPGRLDKILYVGFPTWSDRADILRTITKNGTKPHLADDVDVNVVAEKCADFTGADLAALVREASVCALKEHITELATSSSSSSATSGQTQDLMVQNANFDQAFLKVRPSVIKKDQEMYEKMKTRWSMIC